MNYLSQLPEGTPLSDGIFRRGFYYDGKYIKYRSSLRDAIAPFGYAWAVYLFRGFMLFLWLMTFPSHGVFSSTLFLIMFVIVLLTFSNYLGAIAMTINPSTGFDMANRAVRYGRFFVRHDPFTDAKILHVRIMDAGNMRGAIDGTRIVLETGLDFFAHIAELHRWEERYTNSIIDALRRILGEHVRVEIHDLRWRKSR